MRTEPQRKGCIECMHLARRRCSIPCNCTENIYTDIPRKTISQITILSYYSFIRAVVNRIYFHLFNMQWPTAMIKFKRHKAAKSMIIFPISTITLQQKNKKNLSISNCSKWNLFKGHFEHDVSFTKLEPVVRRLLKTYY